jgi:hypothetical protein
MRQGRRLLLISGRRLVQLTRAGLILIVSPNEMAVASAAVVRPDTNTEVRRSYVYVVRHGTPGDAVLIEWEGVPDFV